MSRVGVVTLVDRLGTSGGAEKLALALTLALDPERFHRTLVISRWGDHDPEGTAERAVLAQLDEAGVGFVGLSRGGHKANALNVGAWRPLVRLLRSGEVAVLHAHKFGSNLWGSVLGRASRMPAIVAHEHSWSYEGQWLRRRLDRDVIARCADAVVAVSREDRRRMIELEGIPPERIVFIPNGIPMPAMRPSGDVRGELGIPPEAPVVGSVGVLRPEKGMDVVVGAAERLAGEFPDLHVLLVGDGPERAQLERQ